MFRHRPTRIEVRAFTPDRARAPLATAEKVVATATMSDGIAVASPSGLVALRLFRLSLQAKADIVALIKTGRVELNGFSLPEDKLAEYAELVIAARHDLHPA